MQIVSLPNLSVGIAIRSKGDVVTADYIDLLVVGLLHIQRDIRRALHKLYNMHSPSFR
jgi:hypothetical protein